MRMIAKKNSAETTAVSCVRHSTQTRRDSAPRHECQKHSISRGGEHRSSTGRRPTPEDTAKESCPPPTCTKQCYPNRCDADQRPGRTTPKRRRLAQANRKASSHPRRSLRRDSKDGAIRTGEQPGKRAARMRKPRKKEPRRRTYARTSKHASDIVDEASKCGAKAHGTHSKRWPTSTSRRRHTLQTRKVSLTVDGRSRAVARACTTQ